VLGLQHEAIATQSDENIGFTRQVVAIDRDQLFMGSLGFISVAGNKCNFLFHEPFPEFQKSFPIMQVPSSKALSNCGCKGFLTMPVYDPCQSFDKRMDAKF
jgi:hypothetical protein